MNMIRIAGEGQAAGRPQADNLFVTDTASQLGSHDDSRIIYAKYPGSSATIEVLPAMQRQRKRILFEELKC